MKRRIIRERIPLIILCVFAVIALVSFILMNLWNSVLVEALHVGTINFWQALGILVLAKILFGGFPGGRGWRGRHSDPREHQWRKEMLSKWKTMTPEERENFKQEFRNRCRGWRSEEVDKKTDAGIE
jgi:hypothetical protein